MCSSKIDHETGRVVVTTATWCEVGHELIGHAATYGIGYSDWVLRLVSPRPSNGHPFGEGVDVRLVEEALRESLQNGSVHPSLVEEPPAAAQEAA